jgi:hypothetical protein
VNFFASFIVDFFMFFVSLFPHQCMQAQSVLSAKDRYLQRKAGASFAAAPAVKKERNGSESTTSSIDAAASSSALVKKEPAVVVGGISIKRE